MTITFAKGAKGAKGIGDFENKATEGVFLESLLHVSMEMHGLEVDVLGEYMLMVVGKQPAEVTHEILENRKRMINDLRCYYDMLNVENILSQSILDKYTKIGIDLLDLVTCLESRLREIVSMIVSMVDGER